ncbi:unnamed protein product [Porites lobata]|uniref:Uncharacterized protein n=1 Tax=Porites lobata TaxID=104759 RepID=A0ABN8NM19_9CNID|nr:unnamed protein product [Porites lobata]
MKTAFSFMMLTILAIMMTSVISRGVSSRRAYRELRARYFRTKAEFDRPAYMNEPAEECGKCFPGCYQVGDNGDQIKTCASECHCPKKRNVDVYFDEPFMDAKDPEFCGECFPPPGGCYQDGDNTDQITTCLDECKCV